MRAVHKTDGVRSLAMGICIVGSGVIASACIGPDVDPEVDMEFGATHALITVDHRMSEDGSTEGAAALAGFAQMPAGVDSEAVLELAGWGLELPDVGTCLELSRTRDRDTPLAPISRVELLEVGDVTIAAGNDETRLAPRAFTGSDVLAGVLYTSRDPSAEPLPPGVPYVIRTSGGALLPALEFEGDAPPALDNIALGGLPLSDLEVVALDEPIDLTWGVGGPSDIFYVELASEDGLHALRCTFRDDEGVGSVPGGTFHHPGAGTLSVHRLRSLEVEGNGIQGELRFDLEQLVEVDFEE